VNGIVGPVLRYRADIRTLCVVAAYFVALGCAWFLPLGNRLVAGGALALLCWLSWINAVITHNVVHLPMWRSPTLNKVTRAALSLTYGFPVNEYVPGHNLSHHRHVQTRRDVMRTTKARSAWNLVNILTFFPGIAIDVMRSNARYVAFAKETRREWYAERNLQLFLTWGVKITLVALDWKRALLFVFVPHLGAVWGITTVNYLWHDGCDVEHPYNHSRNFVGRLFNWLHFNNGFHGMHHLQPALHWSLLPAKHAELVTPHIHPALEQRSFLVYILRTFVLAGRRVRYDGSPLELPEEQGDVDWIGAAADVEMPMLIRASE
jgi:fatty acid desaturase